MLSYDQFYRPSIPNFVRKTKDHTLCGVPRSPRECKTHLDNAIIGIFFGKLAK